jgi:hypothetical protein
MLESILLGSVWFEIGSWFGLAVGKLGNSEKRQNLLINGSAAKATALPVVDEYLEKQTLNTTRMQRSIAARLAKMIRFAVNTRIFELILLRQLNQSWPGQKSVSTEIELHV